MKVTLLLLLNLFLIQSVSYAQFWDFFKKKQNTQEASTSNSSSFLGLSEKEVSDGLKEALTIGIKKGVDEVAKTNGYFLNPEIKIPLPEEVGMVEQKLKLVGQEKLVEDAVESLNRAAEQAAPEAKTLFVNAIKQMTINDAVDILKGTDNSATQYLKKSTNDELVKKFKPIVENSLEKVNATKYWDDVFNQYNKIPFVKKVNPNLTDYVTQKAIDGLFVQIAKEEKEIRNDPKARATDLLEKVFGK
ncbi:DUF4197 domain-containing protein [Sediminitomix flava]|uniref:Uncharacterized protein DUF4197 n=1 Tax=Sediminitomix flava TaxID=379075 RepID=A0A315Z799_SEDFL|nr:DUF4197 domain-containing protein [Sediminitomix flava]PWJ40213.1 uncharacterized protein DUF4197 [Sediminitomix flava]